MSAAAGWRPFAVAASSAAPSTQPSRRRGPRLERGPASTLAVAPARPIPDDPLAAGKQQLDGARRRTGALHLAGRAQLLGLPAVGQCEADPARAQTVLLERNRVIEQLAHHAHG